MRKLYLVPTLLIYGFTQSQNVYIPDPNFKHQLVNSSATSPYQLAKDAAGNWLAVDANDDGEIQLSEAQQVDWLFVSSAFGFPLGPVASLEGIGSFTNLKTIDINQSDLTTLDFTGCTSIEKIDLSQVDQLQSLNLSGLANLSELIVFYSESLQSVTLSGNSALKTINMNYSPGLPTDLTGLTALETLIYKRVETPCMVNVAGMASLKSIDCSYSTGLTSIVMAGATALETVNVRNCSITSLDVSGLPALKSMNCVNVTMTALDFTQAPSLEWLACGGQNVTSLNVQNLANLEYLACGFTSMETLDLTGLANLTTLSCGAGVPVGNLISLPLADVPNLKILRCEYNPIASLDLSAVPLLETLDCSNCDLSELDFTGCYNLTTVECNGNSITSLDVSQLRQLNTLQAHANPLVYLNVKNGGNETLTLNNCLDLTYVCADESQIPALQQSLNNWGLSSCNLNSYCSFEPGGEYFTVSGNARVDGDLNGCDVADFAYQGLHLKFTSDSQEMSVMTNGQGMYNFPLPAGTYSVSPVLENDSYFVSAPLGTSVSFPQDESPYGLDFCLQPNGVHPDLETTILPLTPARPGFDATYRVLFKNKGSVTLSGAVSFSYNESVSDLVSTTPGADVVSDGSLSWNFADLAPMESRWAVIVLNHNSPMETPALNTGSQIDFVSVITPVTGDEMPADNTFALKQIMVNSNDPNDKTCLEGSNVSPQQVGGYVHYLVRFENTGTFAAESIVVRDVIDTAKYDIATLVPMAGSHAFTTRISQDNRVEFIFENIQLPFDDANNDGFVAFKIKTKPELVVGDAFSNSAAIYFDYNFPVVTEAATTTIQALGARDFEFSDYFVLYPNPAEKAIRISSKDGTDLKSVSIYNAIGQIVQANMDVTADSPIDVSDLPNGSYFVKVFSERGVSTAKLIKQ